MHLYWETMVLAKDKHTHTEIETFFKKYCHERAQEHYSSSLFCSFQASGTNQKVKRPNAISQNKAALEAVIIIGAKRGVLTPNPQGYT